MTASIIVVGVLAFVILLVYVEFKLEKHKQLKYGAVAVLLSLAWLYATISAIRVFTQIDRIGLEFELPLILTWVALTYLVANLLVYYRYEIRGKEKKSG